MLLFGMVALEVSPAHAGPITCLPTSVPAEQSSVSNSGTNDIQLNEHDGSEYEPMCGGGIPSRLLTGSGGVKLSAFSIKTKTGYRENRGQYWSIDKDTAGHGERAWKLKNTKGTRVASLYSDGRIAKID